MISHTPTLIIVFNFHKQTVIPPSNQNYIYYKQDLARITMSVCIVREMKTIKFIATNIPENR